MRSGLVMGACGLFLLVDRREFIIAAELADARGWKRFSFRLRDLAGGALMGHNRESLLVVEMGRGGGVIESAGLLHTCALGRDGEPFC